MKEVNCWNLYNQISDLIKDISFKLKLQYSYLCDQYQNSILYDPLKWDWGQWVCVLLYGDNWNSNEEFNKYNQDPRQENGILILPQERFERLVQIKENLLKIREVVYYHEH